MRSLLIIESNSPEMNALGDIASTGFIRCILGFNPAIEIRIASPYGRALTPDAFQAVDGVIFSGSGVAWATDAPEAARLRRAMEASFQAKLPVWGSCNGMQLAAVVLGGSVGASASGEEAGLALDIEMTDLGRDHAMMIGRSNGFASPTLHRDEVQRLPDGAEVLATNSHSQVQAMVYNKGGVDFWGTQYHPELTAADVGRFLSRGACASQRHKQDDLLAAETDPVALSRLGAPSGALEFDTRARELLNWLSHVRKRTAH